jgi:hypothetical protein
MWYNNMNGMHDIIFIGAIVKVFKLAPSSFKYVMTLLHKPNGIGQSFNCIVMWLLKFHEPQKCLSLYDIVPIF